MSDHKDDDYESMATETAWVEVPCQRNISSGQFTAGVQDYVFSIARPQVWMPGQSYFKFEVELLGAGDPNVGAAAPAGVPTLREGVAFAENAIGNMYTNVFCLAGGQSISSITNYAAQASQLMARTSKSSAWQSTVGASQLGNLRALSVNGLLLFATVVLALLVSLPKIMPLLSALVGSMIAARSSIRILNPEHI